MKKYMALLLCFSFFPTTASAANAFSYHSTVDAETSNFDTGDWRYLVTTPHSFVSFGEKDAYTFLIFNGGFPSSKTSLLFQDNTAYLSLDDICHLFGFSTTEQDTVITIQTDAEPLLLHTTSLTIQKGTEILPFQAIRQQNTIYLPLRNFATSLGASVTYTQGDIMALGHPFINIDTRTQTISQEQAVSLAKEQLQHCYDQYSPSVTYDTTKTMAAIRQKINDIHCIGETASFWLLDAPYLLLVDKTTGDLYYKTGTANGGHGSYVETIQPIDTTATDLFDTILLQGFSDISIS